MNVLVLNCGSSSVKFQLLGMDTEKVLAKGIVERIGAGQARLKYQTAGGKLEKEPPDVNDHAEAIQVILDQLTDAEAGVLGSVREIDAVGHRVVHGGEQLTESMFIDDRVYKVLEECVPLAPLHNPANIKGIEAATKVLPGVPQVGVFDTAFHQTMPRTAFLYAVPAWLYEKYRLRRYGFHGTSHRFVSHRCAELFDRPAEELKIITCHLGNGASIAAVKGGKSVDTSMGFTPLEGLVMGSRCGDIDPAIPVFLMKNEGFSPGRVDNLLNRRSGIKGLSGDKYIDMRDVEEQYFKGDPLCREIMEIYAYRIRKYIGAYAAAMNGVDAVVFTAGVGENSPIVRTLVCEPLSYLGLMLDERLNTDTFKPGSGREGRISREDSTVSAWVIPTNEELVIARDTKDIVTASVVG
ncbi:MAG: acetate kinase [Candidatus Coatesbacteria bacterium RBG_13_66_14]|uniref:Acetate kinase n=1 Tax=Candidatus Coatesbacteria bacterium RBG_13_66_14 TaxID=1817816 RepID=A0A1F5EVF9_9BACT|nr:MAG: acetate kinase [Candidatus Coatesbacteria bacterium RBG_13_66_14]